MGWRAEGVLLIFRRGSATKTVTIPGGTIPGHDGSGPLHVAFAIGKDELNQWENIGFARRRDRRHDLVVARRPQHLLPRSGRTSAGAGHAGIMVGY